MKYSTLFLGALFLVYGCSDVSGVSEQQTPEELIIGTWQVSSASIDGQVYPVTNPGFGQIQATFSEDGVEYILPGVDANGIPTIQTDTLNGDWNFNDAHTMLYITNIAGSFTTDMEWSVVNIGVGLLQTSYVGPNPTDFSSTATYDITYRLIQ